jgi:hypothetical protein
LGVTEVLLEVFQVHLLGGEISDTGGGHFVNDLLGRLLLEV